MFEKINKRLYCDFVIPAKFIRRGGAGIYLKTTRLGEGKGR